MEKREELNVISEEKRISSIDFDPKQEMIFWVDSYDNTLKRSYMVDARQGVVKAGYPQDLNIRGKNYFRNSFNFFPQRMFWKSFFR